MSEGKPKVTETDSVSQETENEIKALLDAYTKVVDIWKVQNDNYFKRVQMVMGIVQVGLFLTVVKMLSPLPTAWSQTFWPIVAAILGVSSAIMWYNLIRKQIQYLELCRRILRNIENRLAKLQIPFEYFNLESLVFGPEPKCESLYSASCEVHKNLPQLTFRWSNEQYPETRTDSNNGSPHVMGEVSGGMIAFETRFAQGAVILWILIALVLFIACCRSSPRESFSAIPITTPNDVSAITIPQR